MDCCLISYRLGIPPEQNVAARGINDGVAAVFFFLGVLFTIIQRKSGFVKKGEKNCSTDAAKRRRRATKTRIRWLVLSVFRSFCVRLCQAVFLDNKRGKWDNQIKCRAGKFGVQSWKSKSEEFACDLVPTCRLPFGCQRLKIITQRPHCMSF